MSAKFIYKLAVDLNDYQNVKKVGEGGFGSVHLYHNDYQDVAVKFMSASDEYATLIFERETEILGTLSHPCIVKLHGFSLPSPENDNRFAIVMDYVPGGTLHQAIIDHPTWLDNTAKFIIIYGMVHALAYIHSQNIMRRSLTDRDVLIDDNHYPRICDFGSSRFCTDENTLTMEPPVAIRYSPPEIVLGETYTNKVDVYAFGVLLFEIITREEPFKGMRPMELMKYILSEKRPSIPDTVSAFMKALIEKCWHQEPEHRPTFADILKLIQATLDTIPETILPDLDMDRIRKFKESLD